MLSATVERNCISVYFRLIGFFSFAPKVQFNEMMISIVTVLGVGCTAEQGSTGMTTKESEMNDLDPNCGLEYHQQGQDQNGSSSPGKKTSLFGRIKDRTRNKVSQIKSKVGMKMSGSTPSESLEQDQGVAADDDKSVEEEEDTTKEDVEDTSPPAPTTPSSNTEQETAPASTEFSAGVQEDQAKPELETHTPPQMQDSNGATQGDDQSHDIVNKAAGGAHGLKDAAYGNVAPAAAAVGYEKLLTGSGKKTPQDSNIPNDDDDTSGSQEKAQEFGHSSPDDSHDETIDGVNSAVGNTTAYTQAATDKTKEEAAAGVGNGTTDDTTGPVAADTTKDCAGAVADTAKDQSASATGDIDGSTTDESSEGHVQAATDSAKKDGQQAVDSTAASSAQDDPQKEVGFLGRFSDLIFGKKLPEHETATDTDTETKGFFSFSYCKSVNWKLKHKIHWNFIAIIIFCKSSLHLLWVCFNEVGIRICVLYNFQDGIVALHSRVVSCQNRELVIL